MDAHSRGPLAGLKVIEIASLGPGPFGTMMLADLGADVVRIDRPNALALGTGDWNLLNRSRECVEVDLKRPGATEFVLDLCEKADVLIEGYRPGVMERLGLGPDVVLSRAEKLVYARMTGYGQDGPLSKTAGHDINYLAASGVLAMMPRANGVPVAPLNLVGDMGGGGLLLAIGVLAGVLEARLSGKGQVVDVAMTDGSALQAMLVHMLRFAPEPFKWSAESGVNFLDGGSHFYGTWRCRDGRFIATGAVEPEFYQELIDGLGFEREAMPQWDRARWPELRQLVADRFAAKSQAEWLTIFDGRDACLSPVVEQGTEHLTPHNQARQAFVAVNGMIQPSPAPRFSRTPAPAPGRPAMPSAATNVMSRWGIDEKTLHGLS